MMTIITLSVLIILALGVALISNLFGASSTKLKMRIVGYTLRIFNN